MLGICVLLYTAHAVYTASQRAVETRASVTALVVDIRRQLMRDNYDYIQDEQTSHQGPHAPFLRLEQSLYTIAQLMHTPHVTPSGFPMNEGTVRYKTSLNMSSVRDVTGYNRQQDDTTESRTKTVKSDVIIDNTHLKRSNVLSADTSIVRRRHYNDNLNESYDTEYDTDKTTTRSSRNKLNERSNGSKEMSLYRQRNKMYDVNHNNRNTHNKENNKRLYNSSNGHQLHDQRIIKKLPEYNIYDSNNETFAEPTYINNKHIQHGKKYNQHEKLTDSENLSVKVNSDDTVYIQEDYRHQIQQKSPRHSLIRRSNNRTIQRNQDDNAYDAYIKSRNENINDSDNKISNEHHNVINHNILNLVKSEITTEKVKYKLIKIRNGHGARRVSDTHRHLLEGHDSQGVVIIALDPAPLPQFRLPHSRRQYMNQRADRRHHLDEQLLKRSRSPHRRPIPKTKYIVRK